MSIDSRPGASCVPVWVKAGWPAAAAFLLFFVVTLFLQYESGAFHSEFAGYPDESAHYVTGLMVRDYLAGFHYSEPRKFAEDYYGRFPKVAFGLWPPLLSLLESCWMRVV